MRHIRASAFIEAPFALNVMVATLENGTTFEEILEPEYWMHVADKVKPSFFILALTADQTFGALLQVLRVTRVEVFCALWLHVDLTKFAMGIDMAKEIEKYDISWGGPAYKYRVIYRRSGDVIRDGFDNEAAARTFLVNEHLTQKPLAAPGIRIGAGERALGEEPMPESEKAA